MSKMNKATEDVLAERQRQKDVKGWTEEHDDQHTFRELARAAHCYALPVLFNGGAPYNWPWSQEDWNPKSQRENLVRAGALIIAEIERLDREENE